ncbi:phage integrase N-terminal SAM-like domain-containing protein [Shewanella insulae]|uniref:phage integrase N-terminal SAM-like domain-containing protein n=1 Tax=Shewanella insulae TaxID=2681496 RepID=UPI001EFC60EF|nr:phage integrase N-terminal SAM-like domain-containing protein [Shewanella insulae]MCG9713584.1 phage integrase N-terminal SAM-like domain-containing protein [Shewanella insulae]
MSKSPFIESVRNVLRTKRYSLKTEKAYLYWVRKFIYFHQKRHPAQLRKQPLNNFLHNLKHTNTAKSKRR